jgi:glycosyltransferase involved in cell wall biosynthesis
MNRSGIVSTMGSDAAAPLLSVVVPVYRAEDHLVACLDSVLAEADGRVEVVAVNDGSPDRSGEILDSYAQGDARLRVVHLPTNTGLGQARNAGLEHATGEYVWFVDADDSLPQGSLPTVIERLSLTRPDVLVIGHAEVFDDGRVVRPHPTLLRPVGEPVTLEERPELLQLAQSACTKIARRAFLDEIGLRFAPGWYEDSSFSHPLLMAARRIDVLDRVCYHYHRRNTESITRTVSDRHFDVFDQYRRLFERTATIPEFHRFRPHLFRLMIDHYLVIVGNDFRVPPKRRAEFFHRMAADYRAWMPEEGYERPTGVAGLKHFLVRHDAYRTYAVLRRLHRVLRRLLSRLRRGRPWGAYSPVAAPAAAAPERSDRTPVP